MTDWQERDVKIDFGFLEPSEYYSEIYTDAADANTNPQNVQILKSAVTNGDTKTFRMAKGGWLLLQQRSSTKHNFPNGIFLLKLSKD